MDYEVFRVPGLSLLAPTGGRLRGRPVVDGRGPGRALAERPVWRRLLVPAETSVAGLHEILRTALGWTDEHRLVVIPVATDRLHPMLWVALGNCCVAAILVGRALDLREPARLLMIRS